MQRRTWLQLGVASAAVLAVGGGAMAWLEPGLLPQGRLSAGGRRVFTAVGRTMLDGSLPSAPPDRAAALEGWLGRIDLLAAQLPGHAQAELSQLLALLATAPGRHGLAGLQTDWAQASLPQLQAALQGMRLSSVSLRQQAYHALHDITFGAYFSDASTWSLMGYPGPITL